jgi:hypothetical protein
MKQELSPRVVLLVVAVAIAIAAGVALWAWRGPSVAGVTPSEPFKPHPGAARERAESMRAAHEGARERRSGGAPNDGQ